MEYFIVLLYVRGPFVCDSRLYYSDLKTYKFGAQLKASSLHLDTHQSDFVILIFPRAHIKWLNSLVNFN